MRCLGCGYSLWNLKEPNCPECGRPYDLFDYRFVPGTVAFACPLCSHYHRGAGEQYLPGYTVTSRCAGCGQMIATRQMNVVLLADDPDKAEAMPAEEVPWVKRRVFGRRAAWWATFQMCIVRPREIGRRIGPHTRWQDAYWFAYVSHLIAYGVIGAVVLALAVAVMLGSGYGSMSEMATVMLVFFSLVVVVPLVAPLLLAAVHGSLSHLFLSRTGPRRGTFRHTISSLLYAQGPQIFALLGVIPCAAPFVRIGLTI